MKGSLPSGRVTTVVLLLAVAIAFTFERGSEPVPVRTGLAAFPSNVSGWNSVELGVPADIRDVLGPGDYLSREYQSKDGAPAINLFVAYFPSQRRGSMAHSPKNCLPGAGWIPIDSSDREIPLTNGKRIVVNRYVVQKEAQKNVVLYWYQSHGRAVASEYWARAYLVADAIHYNRTDGALVRVITPVTINESTEAAESRAVKFIAQFAPDLNAYIPD